MTPIEGAEGQTPSEEQPKPPVEIDLWPDTPADYAERTQPDGTRTIFLRGEIRIVIHPPGSQASESPVQDAETVKSSLTPETTSQRVTDRYSGPDKPSWEKFTADVDEIPEKENNRYYLVGNPARKLRYGVTRKSNTRIADFVMATHPDDETTEYWRIRAFGDEAEKVRDQLQVGQKDVAVTVYGPEYWRGSKKRNKKWEETVVKGYRAGFVRIPKRYRQEQQQSSGNAPEQQKN